MHLHGDNSYGYPILCANICIKNFHFPSMQHHPTKFYHFRRRIGKTLGHQQRQDIQAGDKQHARHLNPSHRHRRFPRCYYDTLLLFLPSFQILQPVSNLKSKKIRVSEILSVIFPCRCCLQLFCSGEEYKILNQFKICFIKIINPIWWTFKGSWFEN